MTSQTERNRAIVTTAMEALAKGDSRPFQETWADVVVWRPPSPDR
jgi:ketosteroid isomerase-like protein